MFQTSLSLQLLTIDPSLGRLDYESLSDQALMEMLISGMTTEYKQVFQDENGHYVDVCEWKTFGFTNISCTDARVTDIKAVRYAFNDAQFPFEFIPPLVKSFWMMDCNLHGTLNPSVLPQNILKFDVGGNSLDGSIDCKGFPKKIEAIIFFENALVAFCPSLTCPIRSFYLTRQQTSSVGSSCWMRFHHQWKT